MAVQAALLAFLLIPLNLFAQTGGPAPPEEPEPVPEAPVPEAPGPRSPEEDAIKESIKCAKTGECEKKFGGESKKSPAPGGPKQANDEALRSKINKGADLYKGKMDPKSPPGAPPGGEPGEPPGGPLRDVEEPEGAPVDSGQDRDRGVVPPTREGTGITRESRVLQQRSVGTAARRAGDMLRGLRTAEDETGRGETRTDRAQDRTQDTKQNSFLSREETIPANLANPRTAKELVLAAHSGFGGSFQALGLKAGQGPGGEPAVLRKDGGLATPAEVAALRARIDAEPAALLRRPDFFEALPRERYQSLRRDYASRPELRGTSFMDVGATARERDFVWSSSCDRLSGACNPNSAQPSYRRGQDVSPEDLNRIWSDINKEDEDDSIFEEYTDEERRASDEAEALRERIGRSAFRESGGGGLSGLLNSLGAAARSFLDSDFPSGEGESGVRIGGGGGGAFTVAGTAGKGSARSSRAAGASGAARGASGASKTPRRPARRFSIMLAAAAVAAGLIWFGVRRR